MRLLSRLRSVVPLLSTQSQTPMSATAVNNATMNSTVILGGGVIGLSTAYYIALELKLSGKQHEQGAQVTLIEPSSSICAGASGQNEGVVGNFGIEGSVLPLAKLSWKLHHELAEQYDGGEEYGFVGLDAHALFSHGYDPGNPKLPYPAVRQESLADLPLWLNIPRDWQAGVIATSQDSKRMDPQRFCRFLQSKCESLGVKFMFNASAVKVATTPDHRELAEITVQDRIHHTQQDLPCANLVFAAGSWTGKAFSQLFPHSQVKIPMAEVQTAQAWIRARTPTCSPSSALSKCDQAWLAPALENEDIHVSTYADGTFFVGGPFEYPKNLADLPGDLHMSDSEVENMRESIERFLMLQAGQRLEVIAQGRAHMPRTANEVPIITKIDLNEILPNASLDVGQKSAKDTHSQMTASKTGVFLNVGQYMDGFTLGPGSGKLMSDLVLDRPPSIDPENFKLPQT